MAVINTDPIWVADDAQLAELCQRWRAQAAVAIDTEFERTSTFYPLAALFQVGDGQGCYLIDPLAMGDMTPFADLLADPAVTKVLHACSEDLEVFQRFLGVIPAPLFDTQVAAAFTDAGYSLGYARLVEHLLGIALPKGETRSDWMQRPLSQAQLRYAALDVAYLLVVYGMLLQSLRQTGRLEWVREECARIIADARAGSAPELAYQKIKNAWRLTRPQLGVLQALCLWREREARARDIPRNRLLKEGPLWDLARLQPRHVSQLYKVEGLLPRMIEAEGEALIAAVAAGLQLADADLPPRLEAPLAPATGELLKALKQLGRDTAAAMAMAPEVLVRKKDLEALVRSGLDGGTYVLPDSLQGWRLPVIGEALLALAQQWSE